MDSLQHYASPYYDPVKAHEYYEQHKKLKGRTSTAGLNEEGRKVASYDKDAADPAKVYSPGVEWNGLTGVTEKPSGAEATALYADNIKYLTLMSNEELGLTVEAFTYPEEFAECDGSAALGTGVTIGQQTRKRFGLSYRTRVGNDVGGTDKGYKLHLVYGCLASPSERAYSTINDSPEAQTLSWDVTTNPVSVANHKPTAIVTIDSTKADATKLAALEAKLYLAASSEANGSEQRSTVSTSCLEKIGQFGLAVGSTIVL